MKTKRKHFWTWLVVSFALFLLISYFMGKGWHGAPPQLLATPAKDVTEITIFDGHTGRAASTRDRAEIERIMGSLNSVKLKWSGFSAGRMGYHYRLTLMNTSHYPVNDGGLPFGSWEVILNDAETVRRDPSSYKVTEGDLGLDYIESLLDAQN